MRRLQTLVWLAVFVCVPGVAQASIIDWLEKLSGPGPFIGYAWDLNLLCIDESDKVHPWCERLVVLDTLQPQQIKHIIIARPEYLWKLRGERFDDVSGDDRSVHILKISGLYRYRFSREIDAGLGAGFMRLSGDGFSSFSRATFTPVSISFGPFEHVSSELAPLRLTFDQHYVTQGFTGADFGNRATRYNTHGGEWLTSFGLQYDFTRRR